MRQVFTIAVLMVALMSGILSIGRELVGMYLPNRASQSSVFWRCVWISFILSAAIAWYTEHQKVAALSEALDSSKPKLSGELSYAFVYPSPGDRSTVLLAATIANSGFKSVARGWRLQYRGESEILNDIPYVRIAEDIKIPDTISGKTFMVKQTDSLAESAVAKPIEKGDSLSGWLAFSLPGDRKAEILGGKSTLSVSFSDYLGTNRPYKMEIRVGQPGAMHYVPGMTYPLQ